MMDWTLIRGTSSEPDPSSDVLRQDWQIKAVLASFWPQLLVGAELKAGVLLENGADAWKKNRRPAPFELPFRASCLDQIPPVLLLKLLGVKQKSSAKSEMVAQ